MKQSEHKIKIKKCVFARGHVNLCVPICAKTIEEMKTACALLQPGIDVVEWRMDHYQGTNIEDWISALAYLYEHASEYVILATWRSVREGGVQAQDGAFYQALNTAVLLSGKCDLIDVELFAGEATVQTLVDLAHQQGIKVILSNHDFKQTPSKEAMMIRLQAMAKLGGDIVKLAVMPNQEQDVYDLMSVTNEYTSSSAHHPAITMAMGAVGLLSRIACEHDGSVVSFASLQEASAPGQIPWMQLRNLLDIYHEATKQKA